MKVFVDTSAFYALACASDQYHSSAKDILEKLLSEDADLVTSNYIIVESCSLILKRLGFDALKTFLNVVRQAISLQWVSQTVHEKAIQRLVRAGKRHLSLVDCASFNIMESEGIKRVFSFDPDFEKEGFEFVHDHSAN